MTGLETLYTTFETYRSGAPFTGRPETLYQSMQYIMDLGGKRARPLLTLASTESENGDIQNALPLALTLEVFHNFSLVHDDIMDNADTRRGKPTVHTKWNIPTAILAGDNMLVYCFRMIAEMKHVNSQAILELFTKTASEVCEGQQLDMDFASRENVSETEYLEMIRLKTAVLLGCCAAGGALVSGANAERATLYYDFAINLGMAFQLMDDYLDTFGDSDLTGKKSGGDIAEGKKMWLYIASRNISPEIENVYTSENGDSRIQKATALFKSQGLDNALYELSGRYHDDAIQLLGKIKSTGGRTELLENLVSFLEARTA